MNEGIFLLLGSNQGQPAARLREALEYIQYDAGRLLAQSAFYKSAAWGVEDQPDFYNQVVQIASAHSPETLLEKLLAIERAMGRVRNDKWGPRIIDIDLLLYGAEMRNTSFLQLPHPGIAQRRFTLLPLAEIAGELVHPVLNKTISALLEECADRLWVAKVEG